ncbi:MAG: hypothetical protein A2W29_03515 [Gemmatimonadetes bacterium RBG_16_66_8]|nr:MAG: hypothetical protein A2W29_03515 [Gemmatimonadetes bacterium RBG_16_66_8]
MGYRRFRDRSGRVWEVIARSRSEWEFTPVGDNPESARNGAAPGHETDPFELSIEELQRLLDGAQQGRGPSKPSPFKD